MGCDIHLYVEKKSNGTWEAVSGVNPWIKEYEEFVSSAIEKGETERASKLQAHLDKMKAEDSIVYEGWLYEGRNYNLFAILADVRNRHGLKPISAPRGLPLDKSTIVKEANDLWELDGHSASYFTFNELLTFDWKNNYVENEAYVDEKTYKNFIETGDPYPCCGDIGGGNVEKVLNSEMNRIIKNKYPWEVNKSFYTAIRWKETFYDIAEGFLKDIDRFVKENTINNLDDYRIVFWFDN